MVMRILSGPRHETLHKHGYGSLVPLIEESLADVSALVSYMLREPRPGRSWFRGQGCHRRPLMSSLSRKLATKDAHALLEAEQRLLTRFRQRSLPLWPEGYPQDEWEHLFAMQHFGVPTRLLDWSESLVAGAFFAADHDPKRCECRQEDCRPTVWMLDPDEFNKLNPRLDGTDAGVLATSDPLAVSWAPGVSETQFAPWPAAVYGTHNSVRIVAQQGTFTVSGKNFDPLEESAAVEASDAVLTKIVLEASHSEVMEELKVLGVRRSTIYPDLPSLAVDIAAEELG